MKIGIFDSGVGGLSILKKLIDELPEYDYMYLADNAHVPYGEKSSELILDYATRAVEYLFAHDCYLIILACNSATSQALRTIQQKYLPVYYPNRRVLGVIRPIVDQVVEDGARRVGVMGTRATIASCSFAHEIHKLDGDIEVTQVACPLLVPKIEKGEVSFDHLDKLLDEYLAPFQSEQIESLILGCTHYELVKDQIVAKLGPSIRVYGEGEITARKLRDYLNMHPEIDTQLSKMGLREFYATDPELGYQSLMKLFLGVHFTSSSPLLPATI